MAEHITYIALRDERPSSGDEGDALRKDDTASFESKTDDSETPRSSLDEPPGLQLGRYHLQFWELH